jgi:hypothetical protein
MDIQDILDA